MLHTPFRPTAGATSPADPTHPAHPAGLHERCCASVGGVPPEAPTGSRRRRLWALGPHAHCPVIGVCLPMAAMRRLARKVLGGEPVADDYQLHCGMVTDCKQRTPLAEAVQRELDRRYLLPLRRAAMAKTAEALALWWHEQGASKDLPGALWATLTHPRCTPELEHRVLGQVHMLQHQVGMATRVELARFEALIDENAVLARALGAAQQRCTRLAAEHSERLDLLQADLVRQRGLRLAAESGQALLQADIENLRAAVPDLPARVQLSAHNAQQAERITELQRTLQQLRGELERQQARAAMPTLQAASPPAAEATAPATGAPALPAAPTTPALAQRAVLCVGGRTGSVPIYRRLVEACGGRFLHHDGGEEDSAHRLDSTLAAADLVICQAGCLSHGAYWRVKDHCKRTGKRCVFVDNPSAAGLQRALVDLEAPA